MLGRLYFVILQVGSGKSSLLEALLGELLPLQTAGADILQTGPLLTGSIAYCSQVPWIVSGTLKVRHLLKHDGQILGKLCFVLQQMCLQGIHK